MVLIKNYSLTKRWESKELSKRYTLQVINFQTQAWNSAWYQNWLGNKFWLRSTKLLKFIPNIWINRTCTTEYLIFYSSIFQLQHKSFWNKSNIGHLKLFMFWWKSAKLWSRASNLNGLLILTKILCLWNVWNMNL